MSEQNSFIKLTDEMMSNVGYCRLPCLYKCLRIKFVENTDYRFTQTAVFCSGVGSVRYKYVVEMTMTAYDRLLQMTYGLRNNKRKSENHYVYVLHNPMFLHYGPNVYKIGYSTNMDERIKSLSTGYVEDSVIVYYKEVVSQKCESKLHKMMNDYRMKCNREFFDCPLSLVKEFMEKL